jgi:hypothetical protein
MSNLPLRQPKAHCMRPPIDNLVPTRGGVSQTHGSRRRSAKVVGTEIFIRPPSVTVFPAAVDHVHLRHETVSLLQLRPTTGPRSLSPRPEGRLDTHKVGRLPTSAMSKRCFPTVRRQLQRPPPIQIRPYPRCANNPSYTCHAR